MKKKQKKNAYEEKIERKFSLSKFPPRRIPKAVLARTLKIANDPNDEFWINRNSSCTPTISSDSNNYADAYKKLNLARTCLLTRDFHNLAKLLTTSLVGDSVRQKSSYRIFYEYASMLLTLEDPELLQKLKQTASASSVHNKSKNHQSS